MSVIACIEPLEIPTYPVGKPEKNPVFFEKRVYQGSSGKVYPVPFIDRVFDEPVPVVYQSVRLENDCVRLVILPEIGGRIFIGQDKTHGDYDFFYRQDVIKPALVGLAGPWISGGVEFNWPQHHRPGTFMPCDVSIEEEPDGARTVWLSEHDPLQRMKGMHGIRLRPGSSLIELRVRLYNRTPFTQTFLWWANVAARVHEEYQSFFPPDVRQVADHAVRAMSSFPEARQPYYGVDYPRRPGACDLTWYKNIPVPTSYMICGTGFDFFGGYDHRAESGFVHVADRHIAPGKKQWTWGNHPFGWAWDRELTDSNGPYIELMAGVFTDNQPDFSYLAPYETKTFSQFWWPIQRIGPVQQANRVGALRFVVRNDGVIELGLCVSSAIRQAVLRILHRGQCLLEKVVSLSPGEDWRDASLCFDGADPSEWRAVLVNHDGAVLLDYSPPSEEAGHQEREVATEPPLPCDLVSSDELYLTGEHLEQYRHPTRSPEDYWLEAIRRDPGDSRCHLALGRRALKRGLFAVADSHLHMAIARLTCRHPNPETGEAHSLLGLSRFYQGCLDEARELLAKATWNHAQSAAALYQMACIDCRLGHPSKAMESLNESIARNTGHHKARVLLAAILRKANDERAVELLCEVLDTDPLDHWARCEMMFCGELEVAEFLNGCRNDAQTVLDLVFDYTDAGFFEEAMALLELHLENEAPVEAVPNPLARAVTSRYVMAWLTGEAEDLERARRQSPDCFFPSRLHEMIVLEWALAQPGADPLAAYGLGNFLYDQRRHQDAILHWRRSIEDGADFPTVFRNLGIGLWNTERDASAARACYLRALALDPADARLVSEYDQLRAKLNDPPMERLAYLEQHRDLVLQRDDCTIALVSLLNLSGNPTEALRIMTSRRFHPWEGGEGGALRQYTEARILLGRAALESGDPESALTHFSNAMETPESLGEAYHLLQAKADVNYWTGCALRALGREDEARDGFIRSAEEQGDFAEMAVISQGPLSYYRGLSLRELGRLEDARDGFLALKSHAEAGLSEVAKIDYFATSLPYLLVFDEDLQARRDAENHLLIALACHGLGDRDGTAAALNQVLEFNRADPVAADLLRQLNPRSRP